MRVTRERVTENTNHMRHFVKRTSTLCLIDTKALECTRAFLSYKLKRSLKKECMQCIIERVTYT